MRDDLQYYKERYADPKDPHKSFWASGIYKLMHEQDPYRASLWYQANRETILRDNVWVNAYRPRFNDDCEVVDNIVVLKRLPTEEQHEQFKYDNPDTLSYMFENVGLWVKLQEIPYNKQQRRITRLFSYFCREYGHRCSCVKIQSSKRVTYIQTNY